MLQWVTGGFLLFWNYFGSGCCELPFCNNPFLWRTSTVMLFNLNSEGIRRGIAQLWMQRQGAVCHPSCWQGWGWSCTDAAGTAFPAQPSARTALQRFSSVRLHLCHSRNHMTDVLPALGKSVTAGNLLISSGGDLLGFLDAGQFIIHCLLFFRH